MRESPGNRYPYYLDPALEKKASAFARKVSARIGNRLNRDGIPNANELALLRSNLVWMWCRLSPPWDPCFSRAFPPRVPPRDAVDLPYAAPFCPGLSLGLSRLRYDSPSMTRS